MNRLFLPSVFTLALLGCQAATIRNTIAEPQTIMIYLDRGSSNIKGPGGTGILRIGAPAIETPRTMSDLVLKGISETIAKRFPGKTVKVADVPHVETAEHLRMLARIRPELPADTVAEVLLEVHAGGDFLNGTVKLRAVYMAYKRRPRGYVFTNPMVHLATITFPVRSQNVKDLEKELSELRPEAATAIREAVTRAVSMRLEKLECPRTFCVQTTVPGK